jgi:hypothetical protein
MQVLSVHHTFARTLAFALVLFGVFSLTLIAHAAEVALSPSTGSYGANQTFTVTVQANPQGKSINAVEAELSFDKSKLAVVSVSKTGSAFSLWTTEPTFSNAAGTISFGGGSPSPFSARSTLVSVTFRALTEGTAPVTVSEASVLAADGMGTDVYTGAVNGSYAVTAATTPTPTPTPETPTAPVNNNNDSDTITFGDPPRAPEAGSTVFLDPETWYAVKTGLFTWEVPFDVDEMALDIASTSDYEPVTIYDPPIEQLSITEDMLVEGVQYFTMRYKNPVGWGGILHRKIMIDSMAPQPFTINVRAGNSQTAFPLLTFEAQDETSGIRMYTLQIGDSEAIELTPDQAKIGYLLGELIDGTYTVKVIASDFAGNKRESSTAVLITAGWQPPVEVLVVSTIWDFFKGKNLAIMLLLFTIIGQLIYAAYVRKQHEQKEQKLRKETREIQDQMEKIFSALRDEIYDQINTITKRERLSKKEKEAVAGLTQALEVSETLIEKEITDVSKILK